jgi:hypothetical protein
MPALAAGIWPRRRLFDSLRGLLQPSYPSLIKRLAVYFRSHREKNHRQGLPSNACDDTARAAKSCRRTHASKIPRHHLPFDKQHHKTLTFVNP